MEIPYKILAKEPVKVNMGKPAFSGIFRKVVPAGIWNGLAIRQSVRASAQKLPILAPQGCHSIHFIWMAGAAAALFWPRLHQQSEPRIQFRVSKVGLEP